MRGALGRGGPWRRRSVLPDFGSRRLARRAHDRGRSCRDRPRSSPIRIAFASTYPPRRCGIAVFTNDLSRAVDDREIVALTPPDHALAYPAEVHHRIGRDRREDYSHVARALERCRVGAVSIQHEYGIWGGDDGGYVLDFVHALSLPTVATLHTVLRHPTVRQRRILVDLVAATNATVVMSHAAARLLERVYDIDPGRIDVIPHGVPELPLVEPATLKPAVGLEGREIILSFGLLGPGKGYELAIEAMAEVAGSHPNARYVILGATHPDLLRTEGEAYRQRLMARVADLGLTEHVIFVDQFVGRRDLARWLEAADIFVTPYPNLEQIVSGTLSYAMSAGKAIVSTPYAYASEMLAGERGVLVERATAGDLARAFLELLGDPERRAAVGTRAYEHSRRMIWPEIGAAYRRVFARVAARPSMVDVRQPGFALVDA